MTSLAHIRQFAEQLQIAHHIPGRVRLKLPAQSLGALDTSLLQVARGFQGSLHQIEGIREVRLNPLAFTCIVEYDPQHIVPQAWSDLIAGVASPAAEGLWSRLSHKYQELSHG